MGAYVGEVDVPGWVVPEEGAVVPGSVVGFSAGARLQAHKTTHKIMNKVKNLIFICMFS